MDGHRFEVEREFFCRNAGGTSVELLEASAARGAVANITGSGNPARLLRRQDRAATDAVAPPKSQPPSL